MASNAGFRDFTAGAVLTAAQIDDYLMTQAVMTFADSTARDAAITAPSEGMVAYLKDTDGLYYYSGSTWIEFLRNSTSTYTPTLSQGASSNISKSVQQSYYSRNGAWVTWHFAISVSASGSAGSAITLTLPVTAANSGTPNVCGHSVCQVNVAQNYLAAVVLASTTTIRFYGDTANSGITNGALGVEPSFALASGDYISGTITYKAA